MEHADFIDRLGGSSAVAAALQLSQNTVGNWRKRGVPWKYRPALERMADTKGVAAPRGFIPNAQMPDAAA